MGKIMKKIFSIICAAAMAVSVAGCSKKSDSSDTSSEQKKASPTAYIPKIPKIEKRVIWETDNIRVSSEYFKRVYTGLKIKVENKCDSELILDVDDLCVNDFCISPALFSTIPAGETLYDTIPFYQIEETGLSEIDKAEFSLRTRNSDTHEIEYSDNIIIGTESTKQWDDHELCGGDLLYDNEGIKIIAHEIKNYTYQPNRLPVYIENNSGREIDARFTWAKVNGENIDFLSKPGHNIIPNGKRIITRIDVNKIMEESGADDLKSLKINFDIESADKEPFRTEYLLIKDVSGYEKPTEKTTENKEEG